MAATGAGRAEPAPAVSVFWLAGGGDFSNTSRRGTGGFLGAEAAGCRRLLDKAHSAR